MRAFKRRTDTGLPASPATVAAIEQSFMPAPQTDEMVRSSVDGFVLPRVGEVVDVPLARIEKSKYNARRIVAAAKNEDLALSLEADRQLVPVAAFVMPNGRIGLIDGQRRFEAQRLRGAETLRCEIHEAPADNRALYLASRRANVERESQSPLDDALVWQDLLRDGIFVSQAELAREVGTTETTVSRTLGLVSIPTRFLHMIAERPELQNLRMLDALKRYFDAAGEEAFERMIYEVDHKGLSSRDVDSRRKAIERGPVSRPRSDQRELTFLNGQATLKHFEAQGRIQLQIDAVRDPEIAQQLRERLQQVLNEVLGGTKEQVSAEID